MVWAVLPEDVHAHDGLVEGGVGVVDQVVLIILSDSWKNLVYLGDNPSVSGNVHRVCPSPLRWPSMSMLSARSLSMCSSKNSSGVHFVVQPNLMQLCKAADGRGTNTCSTPQPFKLQTTWGLNLFDLPTPKHPDRGTNDLIFSDDLQHACIRPARRACPALSIGLSASARENR